MGTKANFITHLQESINSELKILQHINQCVPKNEREVINKNHIIKETKLSIDRMNNILKDWQAEH